MVLMALMVLVALMARVMVESSGDSRALAGDHFEGYPTPLRPSLLLDTFDAARRPISRGSAPLLRVAVPDEEIR